MQALTLEVELLISLLIGFAVPTVSARKEGGREGERGGRKRAAEST